MRSNPSNGIGENGKGVFIGPEELELKNEMFEINKFNLLVSNRIALNRTVPDVRLEGFVFKYVLTVKKLYIWEIREYLSLFPTIISYQALDSNNYFNEIIVGNNEKYSLISEI